MIFSNNDVIALAVAVFAIMVFCIYVYIYIYRRGKTCFEEPKASREQHRTGFETSPLLLVTRQQRAAESRATQQGVQQQEETYALGFDASIRQSIYEDAHNQPEANPTNDWQYSTAFNDSAAYCTYCGHPGIF